MSKKLTIELPEDLATFANAKLSAGEYASLDDVVAAGVRELKVHDDALDQWVREEVLPSYERWVADGKPVLTEEEVCASVDAAIKNAAQRKAS